MKEIEEMIADAKAEEEVRKDNEFRTQLKNGLKDALDVSPRVEIPLAEYVALKQQETDLNRLLHAILDNLELNYSGDALRLKDYDTLANIFKCLYNEAYLHIMAAELEQREKQGGE